MAERTYNFGSPESMSNNLSYFFNKKSGKVDFNVQPIGSSKFGADIIIDADALNLDTDAYVEANWETIQSIVDVNGNPKYSSIDDAKADYKRKFSWVSAD